MKYRANSTIRSNMPLAKNASGEFIVMLSRKDTQEGSCNLDFLGGSIVDREKVDWPECVFENLIDRGVLVPVDAEEVVDNESAADIRGGTGTIKQGTDEVTDVTTGLAEGDTSAVTAETVAGAGSVAEDDAFAG